MSNDCDNLDNYLAGDLEGDTAKSFLAHLHACEACREAESEQRWIDGLLSSPARLQLEPAPRALVETLLKSPARPWFVDGRSIAAILAVAAVFLVATGLVLLNREATEVTRSTAAVMARPDSSQAVNSEKAEVTGATFIADSNAIAVPVESRRPGVTIVRVYPTIQPRGETQTAALDSADMTNTEDIWSAYSNGG